MLQSMREGTLAQIIGAHDCLSARIGLAAGFDAVWASSLGLSTVAGRRDRNELSWTELVDSAGEIAQAVDAPVILDANEGYGHDETAKLIAYRAKSRGIWGICLEDKRFPKMNSHAPGVELLDCSQAVSRIEACCDAGGADELFILGRTDALVVGRSVAEAVDRAEAYHEAGACAVIIHSKADSFSELQSFTQQWSGKCPLLAIPTTFGSAASCEYPRYGISGVIWANQLLRSAIFSMAADAGRLRLEGNSESITPHLASLETTFALAGPDWKRATSEGSLD